MLQRSMCCPSPPPHVRCMFSMVDMPTGIYGAGTSTSSVLGAGIRVFPGSFRQSSMCAVIQTRGTALTLSEAISCAPTPSLRGGESRWFASTSEIGGRHSVPAERWRVATGCAKTDRVVYVLVVRRPSAVAFCDVRAELTCADTGIWPRTPMGSLSEH